MSANLPTVNYQLPGVKELLVGATGTGKTTAIRTLVEAGLEVFVIFTEPGMEALADLPSDKVHWKYIPPTAASWDDMLDSAKKINQMSFKSLAELSDINKSKYREFWEVLTTLSNFKCDRTGLSYGPVDEWKQDRVLVMDSLSGLNIMAMNMVTGSKPVKSMADWGVAIDNLERLLTKLCVGTICHFVLIAHLEKETDEMTGGTTLMAATLGRKLAPKLPRFFSDVIHVRRDGVAFTWSTASTNVDLKARNLPLGDKLPPSFVPVINNWRTRAIITQEQADTKATNSGQAPKS